jgi:hypothetical protein
LSVRLPDMISSPMMMSPKVGFLAEVSEDIF